MKRPALVKRTVERRGDSVEFREGDQTRAVLFNLHDIPLTVLNGYIQDWANRGQWPLAATHYP